MKLMEVCRSMRGEVIDACFRDDTFVLEASLYKEESGGLLVLPTQKLVPSAWIKKLLIITVLELDGRQKWITDLRPLQQMTNLVEVRILLTIRRRSKSPSKASQEMIAKRRRLDHPVAAIVECVPKSAKVYIGCDETLQKELQGSFGDTLGYLFEHDEAEAMDTVKSDMLNTFQRSQGQLSGSIIDHSKCSHAGCVEDLDCVNSGPAWLLMSGVRIACEELGRRAAGEELRDHEPTSSSGD